MIRPDEIASATTGAWLLARRQPRGLTCFDATPTGFWRSFWALVLALPGDVVIDLFTGIYSGPDGPGRALVVQAIAYVIEAVAFPLVMVGITDQLGRSQFYLRYMVAYNWSTLLCLALYLPTFLLAMAVPALQPLLLAVQLVLLVYQAYIAHVALAVTPLVAGGITVLAVLLDAVVWSAAHWVSMGVSVGS